MAIGPIGHILKYFALLSGDTGGLFDVATMSPIMKNVEYGPRLVFTQKTEDFNVIPTTSGHAVYTN